MRRTGAGRSAVEAALVRKYWAARPELGLKPVNEELRSLVEQRDSAADEAVADVCTETIDDLVGAFETLVAPPEQGGGRGAIFTPAPIAHWLAREVLAGRRDATVVDPSCGCGALLVAALHELHAANSGGRAAGDIIGEQLYGVDIDADGVRRVRLLLALAAAELGDQRPAYQLHIREADSLDPSTWTRTYDVVIGNPPYVRYHDLSEDERALYGARWTVLDTGNFNLYYAFFELAHRLRAPGGAISYITPNAFLRSASARALRGWMANEMRPNTMVDFGGARIFDGAMTYVTMTVSDQSLDSGGDLAYYVCPKGVEGLAEIAVDRGARYSLEALGSQPWKLVPRAERQRLQRLTTGRTLADVADIKFGASTLRDRLFLLSGDQRDGFYVKRHPDTGEEFLIEPAATRAAVKVSDAATQEELDTHPGRILYPYSLRDRKATVWTADELAEHPGAAAYFEAIRSDLAQRDKGRKTYAAWYAYGRTQSLLPAAAPRLLTPLYAAKPRFLADTVPGRLFLNGCAVTSRNQDAAPLELLGAVLNSGVVRYFVEQTSSPIAGGFFSYQKTALAPLAWPDALTQRAGEILRSAPADRDDLIADCYGIRLPGAP